MTSWDNFGNSTSEEMFATLSLQSLQDFYKVLFCLSKICEDVAIETLTDKILLTGLNTSRSAFALFILHARFFEAFKPSAITEGDKNTTFKIPVKILLNIVKSRSNALFAKADISIDNNENHPGNLEEWSSSQTSLSGTRHSLCFSGKNRFCLKLYYKSAVQRTHLLNYELCDPLHVVFDKNNCPASFRVSSLILADWLSHFDLKIEEISLKCHSNEGMVIKSRKTSLVLEESSFSSLWPLLWWLIKRIEGNPLFTEIKAVDINEFDQWSIPPELDNVELNFNLKDFLVNFCSVDKAKTKVQAVVNLATQTDSMISAYFEQNGRPLLLSVHLSEAATADFVLSTMTNETVLFEDASSSLSHYSGVLTNPQPSFFQEEAVSSATGHSVEFSINENDQEEEEEQEILLDQRRLYRGRVKQQPVQSISDTLEFPDTQSPCLMGSIEGEDTQVEVIPGTPPKKRACFSLPFF